MKNKIPEIKRYNMNTGFKTYRVSNIEDKNGDWVRYEDIKWIIHILKTKNDED